jgi:hypothetical protein
MKAMALRIAVAAGVLSAVALSASAKTTIAPPDSAEWCAIYRNGSENCNIGSQMQCTSAVSGLGGFCRMSFYVKERR